MKLLDVKKEWVGKYQEYKKRKQAAFIEQNDTINQSVVEVDPEIKLKQIEERENKKKMIDDWKERKQIQEKQKKEMEVKQKENTKDKSQTKIKQKEKEKLDQWKKQKEDQKLKIQNKDQDDGLKENKFSREE